MKKVIALTMIMVIALALPAMAALKVLSEELSAELELIAKEHYAAENKVPVESLKVTEGWVRELFSLKQEVYVVVFGEDKSVYVDVATKKVLSAKEMEDLIAQDLAKAPSEPIMRTMSLAVDTTEVEVEDTANTTRSYTAYYVGAALLAGAGAGLVLLKSRAS